MLSHLLTTLLALPIVGGDQVAACEYPSTAALGYCSGVLVHPQVVLTAGHCFDGPAKGVPVHFGSNWWNPIRAVTAGYCVPFRAGPKYFPGVDWGYCWLSEPVPGIPVTPIANEGDMAELQQLDAFDVYAVGFGRDEDNRPGKKKVARMRASHIEDGELFLESLGDASPCRGDSGGPVYAQMPNDGTWRVVATVSYGPGCEDWEATTLALGAADWIKAAIQIDLKVTKQVPTSLTESTPGRHSCSALSTKERTWSTLEIAEEWVSEESTFFPEESAHGCSTRAPKGSMCALVFLLLPLLFRKRKKH